MDAWLDSRYKVYGLRVPSFRNLRKLRITVQNTVIYGKFRFKVAVRCTVAVSSQQFSLLNISK